MTTGRTGTVTRLARPVDLSSAWNATDDDVADRFHPRYRQALPRLPEGSTVVRGLPFALGRRPGRRWVLVEEALALELPPAGPASHLVVAHFSDSWRDDAGERRPETPVGWVLPTGEPLARYELTFTDGTSRAVDIRRRFEIADGIIGWGFVPFGAIGHRDDVPLDWRGPHERQAGGRRVEAGQAGLLGMLPGTWGGAQVGIADFVPTAEDDITYWLHAIPLDGHGSPTRLRIVPLGHGRPGTGVVVAGLSVFNGTADPLVVGPRRQVLVDGLEGLPDIDLGTVIARRAVEPAADADAVDERNRPIGWGRPPAPEPAPTADTPTSTDGEPPRPRGIVDLAAARDAHLHVGEWELRLADLGRAATSPDGRFAITALPAPDVRVDVRLTTTRGESAPARVRFVSADGRYLPPVGHREELNPAILEDTGAGAILGGDTYAYVPGTFQIDLPVGAVHAEIVKGFDHRPVRRRLDVSPATRELDLELERVIDLRSEGWLSADSHVHFLAPSTALLQAAAEDVTFVHLLATQLGDAFTNVTDLAWGSQADPSGHHVVITGTENRQNVLGHLGLLGARRPVLPLASGGGPEGRIGGAVSDLLADWADRCHAEGGLVVGAHFPLPLAEIAADIVAGRIDAIEMQAFSPALESPSIREWYRYLNCGYRVPILGGTDKMSAEMPLGAIRTYARLDPDAAPTFAAWSAAVRAGRTFATSGPVIELAVDGHEPGDVIALSASGGRLQAQARVRAAQPVISAVEMVVDGQVVARRDLPDGATDVIIDATLDVRSSSWIAARSLSAHEIQSAYSTSMAAHTSPVYVEVADHPLFVPEDARAILEVIDGTVQWLTTMATIADPVRRARMADQVATSAALLRRRGGLDPKGGPGT